MKKTYIPTSFLIIVLFLSTNIVAQKHKKTNNWEIGIDLGVARLLDFKPEDDFPEKLNQHILGLRDGLSFGVEIHHKLHPKHHVGLTFKGVFTTTKTEGFDAYIFPDFFLHDIDRETISVLYVGPSYRFVWTLKKGEIYLGTGIGFGYYSNFSKSTYTFSDNPTVTSPIKIRGNHYGFYSKFGYQIPLKHGLKLGLEIGFMYLDIRKTKTLFEDGDESEDEPLNPIIMDNLNIKLSLKKEIHIGKIFKKKQL